MKFVLLEHVWLFDRMVMKMELRGRGRGSGRSIKKVNQDDGDRVMARKEKRTQRTKGKR